MVPKSTYEIKEGIARRQGDKWASPQGERGTGQDEAAAAREAGEAGEPAPWPPRHPSPRSHEDAYRQRLQRHPQSEQSADVSPHRNPDWIVSYSVNTWMCFVQGWVSLRTFYFADELLEVDLECNDVPLVRTCLGVLLVDVLVKCFKHLFCCHNHTMYCNNIIIFFTKLIARPASEWFSVLLVKI